MSEHTEQQTFLSADAAAYAFGGGEARETDAISAPPAPAMRHTVEMRTFTPGDAADALENTHFARQRRIKRSHVDFLHSVHRQGEFDNGAAIRFATFGSYTFLVDGQHRLTFIAEQDQPVTVPVVTTECASIEEVGAVYARIDRGRPRWMANAMKAIVGEAETAEEFGVSRSDLAKILSCAGAFSRDLTESRVGSAEYEVRSADGRLKVMRPYMDAAKDYIDAISGARGEGSKLLRRREAMTVGIATFAETPAKLKARGFWQGIAEDDGLRATDPRKQALDWMRRTPATVRAEIGPFALGLCDCWEKWFRGLDMHVVKAGRFGGAIRIAGTRWKGTKGEK